jgi:hypothetical protein
MKQIMAGCKLTKVANPTTASATGDVDSDVLDMANYDGVVFFTSFGTANSSNSMKAKSHTTNTTAGSDLTGTSVNSGSSDEDVWVELYRPRQRYVHVKVVREAATKLGDIWALQYGARVHPQDNAVTGTIVGEIHASPTTGTA